jgi:hypothetical protein
MLPTLFPQQILYTAGHLISREFAGTPRLLTEEQRMESAEFVKNNCPQAEKAVNELQNAAYSFFSGNNQAIDNWHDQLNNIALREGFACVSGALDVLKAQSDSSKNPFLPNVTVSGAFSNDHKYIGQVIEAHPSSVMKFFGHGGGISTLVDTSNQRITNKYSQANGVSGHWENMFTSKFGKNKYTHEIAASPMVCSILYSRGWE